MSAGMTFQATMRGEQFTDEQWLIVRCCSVCSVAYAIPQGLYDACQEGRREDSWYCPNGHTQFPTKTDIAETKRRLKDARDNAARLRAELDQTEARLLGQVKAKTRFKNERDRLRQRAAAGVCPCCNRTFKQLARHMEAKHPGFPAGESA